MSGPYVLKWGILGAGYISSVFIKDLLVDPKTRGVNDIVHKVVAVGSRDVQKAQEFVDKTTGGDKGTKAYGSYEEVVADPDVDVVYVGTPHTHHYTSTKLALEAKKNVLCEKPFTTNAAELRSLIEIAKQNGVFLMEAMWTRFLPIVQEVLDLIKGGELGDIRVLHADLSGDFDIHNIPKTHRILDPKLGGGALLDIGPYPLVWAIIALFEHPGNDNAPPSKVTGSMLKTPLTGVDSNTTFVLNFDKIHAQAILSCGITLSSPAPPVTIRFTKGTILLHRPCYRPKKITTQYFSKVGGEEVIREETKVFDFEGGGWHFQADEVAKSIRDGLKESKLWSLQKSLLEMEIFDEVRKQGEYTFPPGVEHVV